MGKVKGAEITITFSDLIRDTKIVMSIIATILMIGVFIGQMINLGDKIEDNRSMIDQNSRVISEIRDAYIEQKVDIEYIKKGIDELKKE